MWNFGKGRRADSEGWEEGCFAITPWEGNIIQLVYIFLKQVFCIFHAQEWVILSGMWIFGIICVENLNLLVFQGGIFEALSFHKMWKAFKYDFQGSKKLVFSLRRPKSCLPVKSDVGIKITTKPKVSQKDWDFEISGYFPDKKCSIIDSQGNVVAQVRLIISL